MSGPRDLRTDVRNGLKAGLRVEDISLNTGHVVSMVRFMVRMMRANGELEEIYRAKGNPE